MSNDTEKENSMDLHIFFKVSGYKQLIWAEFKQQIKLNITEFINKRQQINYKYYFDLSFYQKQVKSIIVSMKTKKKIID